VVAAGRWWSRAELDADLERIAASFAPLEAELARVDRALESGDPADWVAALRELDSPSEEITSFVESEINRRGYELLGDGRVDEAIEVFTLNTRAFSASANTWDSLAEAWLEKGDRDRSIAFYRQALEVDPELRNAARMLESLGVEP
jgi:tetratricopeptide (TPR) repeat protein